MPKKLDPNVAHNILETYRSGRSIASTAKMVGVCTASVVVYLRQHGLLGKRPRKWPKEKQKEVVELYSLGLSAWECARHFGCKPETVAKYLRLHGVTPRTHAESMQGAGNPAWRGGRTVQCGYVFLWVPDHPNANSGGYVQEHRLVMEEHLGRLLLPSEVVHHKDKNKQNNHIDNLELFASNGEHLAFELKGQVPKWTEDGKRRIREGHPKPGYKCCKKPRPKTDAER